MICPMRFITGSAAQCWKEECAWYLPASMACALIKVAVSLDIIAESACEIMGPKENPVEQVFGKGSTLHLPDDTFLP